MRVFAGLVLILFALPLCGVAGFTLYNDATWLLQGRTLANGMEQMTARVLAYDLAALLLGVAGLLGGVMLTDARPVEAPAEPPSRPAP
ncbi:MAG: hypothetical protein JNK15_03195 [Planctomycetes bacterium]|nr:hypothetical protein [Planctomycetota bacterium]